MLNRRI